MDFGAATLTCRCSAMIRVGDKDIAALLFKCGRTWKNRNLS